MPKASLTLANGTVVNIEGTAPEIHELLSFYSPADPKTANERPQRPPSPPVGKKSKPAAQEEPRDQVDLVAIVNQVRSCDEAENIETLILDKADQLARVLLPMYIVYEHMNNAYGLTSGQISKVTIQLGVPVKLPNVSKMLSGPAAKYVIGDSVRKPGQAVRYKLSRRGHKYLKVVITAHSGR
jgi:hypothetical protein